jgi:8-oxo-dGTP pyrophosphatase MutT (NUDIX family)
MKTIAGCILRNERGEFLLVQEKQERVYGKWNIPAGYAEEGEGAIDAAVRETFEEVGYTVTINSTPVHQYVNDQKQKIYVAFEGTATGGSLRIQEAEILYAQWVSFERIVALHNEGGIREDWIFEALQKVENAHTGD